MRRCLAMFGCAALAGCTTTANHVAPQLVPAADVIRQVKYEIGKFAAETATPITTPGSCLANFALTIDSADIALTTTTSSSTGGSIGAQVPLNLVTIKGGGGVSTSRSSSQSLRLSIKPRLGEAGELRPPTPVWQGEPFYRAMMDVRAAIVAASDQRPCVTFDADNSVAFGFASERSANTSVGVNLLIFSLGSEGAAGGSAAHSITLHFSAPGAVGFVRRPRP